MPESEQSLGQKANDETTPTETSPLLANSDTVPVGQREPSGDLPNYSVVAGAVTSTPPEDEKLPVKQILLLCYARLFEPIAFFTIFPFVNQMIFDTGEVAEADVGFYSGVIESLFSLTQMFAMLPWGRLADNPRIGRKPVLVTSLIGVAISMALFGMSKTIWQMIITRCCAGIFAGTVVTIRTMISEKSTPKTQARAFSWFAFTGNLGIFIGPLLGGALADPAHEYSRVFGRFNFLIQYPYALPTFVAAVYGISAAIICLLFLNETLKPKESSDGSETPTKKMSTWDLLKTPGVLFVLGLYGYIMILAFSYTAVVPVFLFTPVRLSGFGFSPLYISVFMAVGGLSQSVWLLGIFPWLQRRVGTGGVLRICAYAYPFFFVAFPIASLLLRHDVKVIFWMLVAIGAVFGSGVAMSFTAIQLSLNDVNPSPETLGTLNALALAFVSGIRSFSPALFTSLFAVGVRNHILDGYLVWLTMTILAIGYVVIIRFLPVNAEGKTVKEDSPDDTGA